jgi:osmotically inducible protein OsmC
VTSGTGVVRAGSDSFTIGATFPSTGGEAPSLTTPEELLAASHAVCFGIGLRGLIARRGGHARRVTVTATITADKGRDGIRIQAAHLEAVVTELVGISEAQLLEINKAVEEGCTISFALRGNVAVTSRVSAE